MKELNLHALGQMDNLKSLKENFESLKGKLKNNDSISEIERKVELEIITKNFEKEKKDLIHKLF